MRSNASTYSAAGIFVLFTACALLYFMHDFTFGELQRRFVLGQDGVAIYLANHDTVFAFDPWEPLEKNFTLTQALSGLCLGAGLPETCYRDTRTRFTTFRKDHIVESGGKSHLLERNATPVRSRDISPDFLRERMQLVSAWATQNQRPDGSFPYAYAPTHDSYSDDDYAIRQLLTIQGFFAVANELGDQELRDVAQRAQENIFDRTYRTDPRGFSYVLDFDGRIPLGNAAIAILMLREKAQNSPLSDRELALAEFILQMQRPDGSFRSFLGDETSTENEQFYSGEALTALALVHRISPDARYGRALERGYVYYSEKLKHDFMPQYAPWHMQAYAIAYENSYDERYAAYTFWLADGLIETMLDNDKHAQADEVGRFYNPEYPSWGPPHSASTGIYVEGLMYAYSVAKDKKDSARMKKYRDAILAGTRSLLLVQWTPESAYYLGRPERVIGAFKATISDNRVRIDQVGHTANAFVLAKHMLEGQ
jgi:hypothetical protein